MNEFGTIQGGKVAVLLAGNPLQAVRNTQSIEAVVTDGRFLSRAELDDRLATAAGRILHPTMLARPALLLACVAAIVATPARSTAQADALFEFHSNSWLNLHHILWARGERAAPPADMPDAERSAWNEGIAFYAP